MAVVSGARLGPVRRRAGRRWLCPAPRAARPLAVHLDIRSTRPAQARRRRPVLDHRGDSLEQPRLGPTYACGCGEASDPRQLGSRAAPRRPSRRAVPDDIGDRSVRRGAGLTIGDLAGPDAAHVGSQHLAGLGPSVDGFGWSAAPHRRALAGDLVHRYRIAAGGPPRVAAQESPFEPSSSPQAHVRCRSGHLRGSYDAARGGCQILAAYGSPGDAARVSASAMPRRSA